MEALIMSIAIYLILVGTLGVLYFIYKFFTRQKKTLTPIIAVSRKISTMDKLAKLATSYRDGKISRAEFELEKDSILDWNA